MEIIGLPKGYKLVRVEEEMEEGMNEEKFDLGKDGSRMFNCKYADGDNPAIILDHVYHMTYERCNAIQRKLAELSEGLVQKNVIERHGEKVINMTGFYNELSLERMIQILRKANYQKKSLTAEDKLDRVLKAINNFDDHADYVQSREIYEIKKILEDS